MSVEIKLVPGKGRALFARRKFSAKNNEQIYSEKPLLSIQFAKNQLCALACATCRKFIGSLQHQIATLSGRPVSALPRMPVISSEDATLSACVACPRECGQLYCSAGCRDQAELAGHAMLCLGKSHNNPALAKFFEHARAEHQFFILAAQLIAMVHTRQAGGMDEKQAMAPFADLCRNEWWNVTDLEDEDHSPDEVVQELQNTLKKSFVLARLALFPKSKPPAWFTETLYAELVGMFRLNNIAIDISSPLRDYFEMVDALKGRSKADAVATLAPLVRDMLRGREQRKLARIAGKKAAYAKAAAAEVASSAADAKAGDAKLGSADAKADAKSAESTASSLSLGGTSGSKANAAADDEEEEEVSSDSGENTDTDEPQRFDWTIPTAKKDNSTTAGSAPAAASVASSAPDGAAAANSANKKKKKKKKSGANAEAAAAVERKGGSAERVRFDACLFPAFHGSGLFPTLAAINHSCEPNAEIAFAHDGTAICVAVRDIAPGDEISISYLDEDLPVDERRKQLMEWGFLCECPRCEREESDDGKSSSSAAASKPKSAKAKPSAGS